MSYLGAALITCVLFVTETGLSQVDDFQTKLAGSLPANGASCRECHATPVSGGGSRVLVFRIPDSEAGKYSISKVLHSNEHLSPAQLKQRAPRVSISLLGDGLIEAIDDQEILGIAALQLVKSKGKIEGQAVRVVPFESPDRVIRVGKFGWKAQHSSLFSSCADSLLNELGIPNTVLNGGAAYSSTTRDVLQNIVDYVRGLPPPSRDLELAETHDAATGERIFGAIGCESCHTSVLHTVPPGTRINGGMYIVPDAFGGKTIHPYSDFLLHDVGTGDGLLQAAMPEFADPSTSNKFRTPPLWGLRFRSWLMHDGQSVTLHQAIMRHSGEAVDVTKRYEELTPTERHQLQQFLNSL